MTQVNEQVVWKCEQWFAGQMQEQQMFLSEARAREFGAEAEWGCAGFSVEDRGDADPACLELSCVQRCALYVVRSSRDPLLRFKSYAGVV